MEGRKRVYVTRQIAQEALDMIATAAEMKVWEGETPPPREILLEEARSVDGLLTLLTDRVDTILLEAAPTLKVVSNMAAGYDNIDIAEATRRGILVGYTPGTLTETTADLTFALLSATARRVVDADRFTRSGKWKTWGPKVLLGRDIHGATLGIIGLGKIGTAVAKRARGFDMQLLYYSRTHKADLEEQLGMECVKNLEDLLLRSDFITVHVPLTDETYHLIGSRELAIMKPTAILVNTSRGAVVDGKALYQALKSRQILAAALDVTEVEPISMNDPLFAIDNLIVTPHIGSATAATRTKMARMAAQNLLAGLQGQALLHCVNPQATEG